MVFIILVLFSFLFSQALDDFSDGNINLSPVWSGDTASWQIVESSSSGPNTSGSMTLRMNAPDDGSLSQYISLEPFDNWEGALAWGAWVGRRTSSSYTSSNTFYYYLWSNSINLESDTANAYRIRIGDNSGNDEIYLERIDEGVPAVLITGTDPIPNGLDDISMLLRITRTQLGEFSIYTSVIPQAGGDGPSPLSSPSVSNTTVFQGSATDITYDCNAGGFSGFKAVHSSGSTARSAVEIDQVWIEQNSDFSLPVFISSFNADQKDRAAVLTWRTESEIENLGFEIFRREGNSPPVIIASYRSDAALSGSGSSAYGSDYRYTDLTVLPGIHYTYILHQIDYDGRDNVVGEVQFKLYSGNERNHTGVFPNPVRGKALLRIEKTMTPGELTVFNLLGQEIAQYELHGNDGEKTIIIDLGRSRAAGVYIATLRSSSGTRNYRFLYMP